MYQNESFDEYIRSILGYPSLNNMQMQNTAINEMFDYSSNNYMQNMDDSNDSDLEECYPEIYKLVYPMIVKRCSRVSEPITKEIVNNITDEIYNAIEVTNEVNVNINLQNGMSNNRTESELTISEISNKTMSSQNATAKTENRAEPENRQFRNRDLRDLIQILIIRELLRRRHPGRRPPIHGRPPFPGGGRPPIMPRNNLYDIYE